MTTIAQLSQQLSSLSETLRQTQDLISRLSKLTFQPGSEPLDDEAGSARIELAQDIHDSLKQHDEDLELLQSEIDDLNADTGVAKRKGSEREQERERLTAGITRLDGDLQQTRASFRQAQLKAKKASEAAKAQERQLVFKSITSAQLEDPADPDLFAGKGHRRQRTQQLSKDEILVNASSDVTSALRRTHDLLSTELSRSRFAQETFDESTEALKELGEKYSDLDTILANSRSLLSTLLRSQKSDTWYLETAFYLLLVTLIWLVFRRLLFGPFVKLPLFLWNVFAFLTNWVVLKPLYLLLTLVGVIRSEPVQLRSAPPQITKSRSPLIIQPSASDFAPNFLRAAMSGKGVPAGAGGAGAKVGKDGALSGKLSEQIGQMAEDSARNAQEQQQNEPIRRGDGTILQERGDIPKNPKKKAFEADVNEPRLRQKRDEL